MSAHSLICHPATPSSFVRRIDVDARISSARLDLRYRLFGEIAQLRVPMLDTSIRTDKLWERTCFEVFVKRPKAASYYEFNFSPSTRWTMYRFDRYRDGMSPETFYGAPKIDVDRSARMLTVACSVDLALCRELVGAEGYQLALSAVVEDNAGQFSYWALTHPPGKPDFHHSDSFVLALERSDP